MQWDDLLIRVSAHSNGVIFVYVVCPQLRLFGRTLLNVEGLMNNQCPTILFIIFCSNYDFNLHWALCANVDYWRSTMMGMSPICAIVEYCSPLWEIRWQREKRMRLFLNTLANIIPQRSAMAQIGFVCEHLPTNLKNEATQSTVFLKNNKTNCQWRVLWLSKTSQQMTYFSGNKSIILLYSHFIHFNYVWMSFCGEFGRFFWRRSSCLRPGDLVTKN